MTEHRPDDETPPPRDAEPTAAEPILEQAAPAEPAAEEPAPEEPTPEEPTPEEPTPADDAGAGSAPPPARRRRRDPLAAALIGVLTVLLGFALAVQVRSTDEGEALQGAREEDLVRILDELNAREERLREQIAEERAALEQLSNSDGQAAAALEEARSRAEAIAILNGTIAARGPGLVMTIRDPGGEVRVADLLDAIQELRGAGAETMQIDDVRVGVSTAITGEPGGLQVDGRDVSAPYEFRVIGHPQNMETAMNIPGGVVQRISGRGGAVTITQSQDVLVDALRPLDTPQYASPETD
jgi:uncharacterized protein YlxW (UPF0749 family)